MGGWTASTDDVFFRVHWGTAPEFSEANAYSRPWGEMDAEPSRGYSSFSDPDRLLKYFPGGADGEKVYIYKGNEVGTGPDLESLSVPKGKPLAVISWEDFHKIASGK